jgi:hypothetical protein
LNFNLYASTLLDRPACEIAVVCVLGRLFGLHVQAGFILFDPVSLDKRAHARNYRFAQRRVDKKSLHRIENPLYSEDEENKEL